VNGIIPVIDLKQGQVVHAIAGDRDNYRPIQSQIAEGSSPTNIATAFQKLGFRSVYVADLDAITGVGENDRAIQQIIECGFDVWLDSGVTSGKKAQERLALGIKRIVVGLEAIEHSDQVVDVIDSVGIDQLIVSIDMENGAVLTRETHWGSQTPLEVARQLFALGANELILLDLTRVGTGQGTGTKQLCQQINALRPGSRIYVGGGVVTQSDVDDLLASGADGVLVSTALHRGTIGKP
jgi:phosphoribosylformimino-5-aminoimidazole carboxamide ribotide isomerase